MQPPRALTTVAVWAGTLVVLVGGTILLAPAIGRSVSGALLLEGALAALAGVALWRPASARPPSVRQPGPAPAWLTHAERPEARGLREPVGIGLFLLALALWAVAFYLTA